MSIEKTTLLFELSEILDELEGVFINITYEFDTDDIIANGIEVTKNLKVLNIQINSIAHSSISPSYLQNEVKNYLHVDNGYYAKLHFTNSEVSPFNTSSFGNNEYQELIKEYTKHHKVY